MLHNNSKVDKKETRLIAVPPFLTGFPLARALR
jgi:hypothetical protein